jgi:hypothetical protein
MANQAYKPVRPDPVASFSEHFRVKAGQLAKLGAFDSVLERDSPFAISPRLLDGSKAPELAGSHELVLKHFTNVIDLLEQAKPGDALWRAAADLFNFPEFAGASLGYSAQRGNGRGWPVNVRNATLQTAKAMVDAGVRNPRIFELVSLFQEGIGHDLVSDMIGNILREPLIAYTQRIAAKLRVALVPFNGITGPGLPAYLNASNEVRYVILVPEDILSDLPVAMTYKDIGMVASANVDLRAYFNKRLGTRWRLDIKRSMSKRNVRDAIINSAEFVDAILRRYEAKRVTTYNFERDPKDGVRWLRRAKHDVAQNPVAFSLAAVKTPTEAIIAVSDVLEHFKKLTETTRVKAALYNDDKTSRHETGVQDVFYAVAASHTLFNNLDVSAEVVVGNGKVDYKFSLGRNIRIVVEMKLARNGKLIDGLRNQLQIYIAGEDAIHAFYLVINNGGAGADKNVADLQADIADNGVPADTTVIICDARQKMPPSKIRSQKKEQP